MSPPHVEPGRGSATGSPQSAGIARVTDADRAEAVARLVAGGEPPHPVHADRFIDFSRSHGIRIDDMWALRDEGGRIVATVLAVPNPGRTAIVFTNTPRGRDRIPGHAALIDHACRSLCNEDVHLVQALLEPHDRVLCDTYAAAGLTMLSRLSYMERTLPGRTKLQPPQWPKGVEVETYRDDLRDDLLEILDASYEETLDCPGLRGLRRTEDILAGHRATGTFDPALWTILRVDDRPAGALLLNSSTASDAIELVYIGLARAARGRGLGRRLLRHGLRGLVNRAERAVTLAVDEQNEPAIALYRQEGFRRVLRRCAMIRSLRSSA